MPENCVIERSFGISEKSFITLPPGHHYLIHTTGDSHTTKGVLVEMTMILCVNDAATKLERKFYILYQEYLPQKNKLINVAFYISAEKLTVGAPLCENDVAGQIVIDRLKSPNYNIAFGIKEALRRRGLHDLNSLLLKSRYAMCVLIFVLCL